MKQIKILALTFFALALFAVNAAAQCGGKQVYIQLPQTEWSKTAINIYSAYDGSLTSLIATVQNEWSVFAFPSGWPNDRSEKSFSFSMKASNIDSENNWIASNGYNVSGLRPMTAQSFTCELFGSSNVLYIYPNPKNPSQTIAGTQPPNAYNFYFLPPNDPEWTTGSPFLVWVENGIVKKEKFSHDSRCGWLKKTWFNATPPNGVTLIWLNDPPNDQLGLLGLEEDPANWISGNPTPFNLLEQFNNVVGGPGDLFFIPSGGAPIWSKYDQGKSGICSYNFAAIIYDTDKSVNLSFSENEDDIGAGRDTWGYWTSGIIKGMVKPTLNPNTRKIECQNCARGGSVTSSQGYFTSQQDFNNAFDPTSSTNVVLCYDMPFSRTSKGLWEFDSDRMMNNNGKTVGGFFPEILQNRQLAVAAGADYSKCNTCDTKYYAEGFVNLTSKINPWCFDRGLTTKIATGDSLGSCGTPYGPGAFAHGQEPADTWGATPSGNAEWNSTWRNNNINLWGGSQIGANAKANQFFCFESHAEFVYEKGQEFFFRGDDDIWVYMNNKLVVDLGGSHLAAPGYVNLDTLHLIEGEKYPIDIFFCDRRTTMSNVRITTNMYFAQKNLLSVHGNPNSSGGVEVCMESSGSSGTCADLLGNSSGNSVKCGSELGNVMDYYMLNRKGVQQNLNPSNPSCSRSGDDLVCYGGVTLVDYYKKPEGSIEVVRTRAPYFGLVGSYKVYAKIKPERESEYPNAMPVLLAQFTVGVSTFPVWGDVYGDDGKLIYSLGQKSKSTVSGKLVPIGFAAGIWGCDDPANYGETGCTFEVYQANASEGGSYGQSVNIKFTANPGNSNLRFFTDSLGQNEVYADEPFIIPSNEPFPGLLVLWVTGDYSATEEETYTINDELIVTVNLPQEEPNYLYIGQIIGDGKEICLKESKTSVCGAELASRLSYSITVPRIGSLPLSSDNPDCIWVNPTLGVCYGGILMNNGVVSVDEHAITEEFFIQSGFEVYARVSEEYLPLNVFTKNQGSTPIISKIPKLANSQELAYYSLKGELLKQKPKTAGTYIIRKNGAYNVIMVK
ncbi:MAG: fibro-slime domain-containing protein [Fibromonadales bacterium]|nr:fibro-slime domain-containing protein [Fibromonadales bacterium]